MPAVREVRRDVTVLNWHEGNSDSGNHLLQLWWTKKQLRTANKVNGLQPQKATSGFTTPVSQEQKSEATLGTDSGEDCQIAFFCYFFF